jgi:hypothetical protein
LSSRDFHVGGGYRAAPAGGRGSVNPYGAGHLIDRKLNVLHRVGRFNKLQ